MEWFEDRFAQFTAQDEARRKIAECAEGLYENLWAAVAEIVKAAVAKGIDLKPNGFPLHHQVKMGNRKLNLDLFLDVRQIVAATHDAPDLVFNLAICDDGSVCLRRDGRAVNLRSGGSPDHGSIYLFRLFTLRN
jgi:hypothetical protein